MGLLSDSWLYEVSAGKLRIPFFQLVNRSELDNRPYTTSYTDLTFSAYCLSQPVNERCVLQFSLTILLIVIGCNVVKLACLVGTIWTLNHTTLVTLGDAVVSFLEEPDSITQGYCMASRKSVEDGMCRKPPAPTKWDYRPRFWFAAASWRRLILCNALWVPHRNLIAGDSMAYLFVVAL